MSAKSIFEADGKAILNYHLTRAPVIKPSPLPPSSTHNPPPRLASIYFPEDAEVKDVLDQAEVQYPWLLQKDAKFVAKPDQLIKRRGKSGLLTLNKTWPQAKEWIAERAGKTQRVETVDGVLRRFLVEPFVPHPQETEYYICIQSVSRHNQSRKIARRLTMQIQVREVRIPIMTISKEHGNFSDCHSKILFRGILPKARPRGWLAASQLLFRLG